MAETKKTWGGKRDGAGRKKSGDPVKKFSLSAKQSEYDAVKKMADEQGKSLSRLLIDLALDKNS